MAELQAGFPRWLIVVRRDQLDLYRNLREAFSDVPRVAVILDRRQIDRRQGGQGHPHPGPDRRRRDRRQMPSAHEVDLWDSAGFRLIHAVEDLAVYEAADEPSADR